jgi:hypothetical protein
MSALSEYGARNPAQVDRVFRFAWEQRKEYDSPKIRDERFERLR